MKMLRNKSDNLIEDVIARSEATRQ